MAYSNKWEQNTPANPCVISIAPNAGDILIAWAFNDEANANDLDSDPAGWTLIFRGVSTNDNSTLRVCYKIATGAETSVSFNSASGNIAIGGCIAFSGRDTTTPLDVTPVTLANSTSQTTADLSITPVTDGADLCFIFDCDGGNSDYTFSFSTISGTTGAWTTRVDQRADFRNAGVGSATQATAGALTARGTSTVAGGRVAVLIALRPSSSPATLSNPTPSGTVGTETTATVGATTDQTSGTLYAVVDTAANLAGVTATQIKAGQKASGSAALAANSATVSTTTPSAGVTGLTANTLYSYAIVQNNANGDSNVVTGTFTTYVQGASSGPGLVIGDEAGFVGEGAIGAPNVAGGPVTYDVSISEATSAADAFASVATFARSVAEAVALADTPVGLGVFPRALAESVTPTDAMTGGSAFASSLAESITPTYAPSLAYATNPSLAESLTTLDTVASALQAVAALTEAVAATDAPTAARVTAPSLTEAVSAADTFTGGLALLASLSESTAVADTVASILAAVGALAESFTITDTQNADQAGVISVSMSESFTASDAVASALNALNALTETLTLSETVARAWITTAGLAESVTPTDLVSATRALAAGLTEAATLVDSVSSIGVFSVQIAEAAALIDAPQAAALLSAALGEAITPTDIVAAIAASYPGDPRRTFTVSGGRGLVVQAGDRVVVVTRNDRTVH